MPLANPVDALFEKGCQRIRLGIGEILQMINQILISKKFDATAEFRQEDFLAEFFHL